MTSQLKSISSYEQTSVAISPFRMAKNSIHILSIVHHTFIDQSITRGGILIGKGNSSLRQKNNESWRSWKTLDDHSEWPGIILDVKKSWNSTFGFFFFNKTEFMIIHIKSQGFPKGLKTGKFQVAKANKNCDFCPLMMKNDTPPPNNIF